MDFTGLPPMQEFLSTFGVAEGSEPGSLSPSTRRSPNLTDTDQSKAKDSARDSRGSSSKASTPRHGGIVTSFLHEGEADGEEVSRANPNGFRTPNPDATSSGPNPPKSATSTKFDAKTLLSPTSKGSRYAPEVIDDDEESGSTVSMLERLHRTQGRENVPRRRKLMQVDGADEEEVRKKAKFDMQGGGGIISDFLADERKKAADESKGDVSALVPTVIDLTDEPDDNNNELFPTGPRDDDIVVMGRLDGAKVLMSNIPHVKEKGHGVMQASKTQWPQMRVVLRWEGKGTFLVKTMDCIGFRFGTLPLEPARALSYCFEHEKRLKFSYRASLGPQPRTLGEMPGDAISKSAPLQIVLLAARRCATEIGEVFKKRGLKLADCVIRSGEELVNPHNPKPSLGPKPIGPVPANYSGQTINRTEEEVRSDIMNMFDSITNNQALQEMEQHPNVTTPLLKHQKEGLYFLTEREKDHSVTTKDDNEDFYLWKPQHLANGKKIWYNVITGHQTSSKPPLVKGGILADMMGLGKTLSTLSLVVGSMDKAETFSRLIPPRSPSKLFLLNSKATLLVCPLSTVANWEQQVKDHIKRGSMKYYIYHGNNREQNAHKLAEYDLVITSYHTLMPELRKQNSPIYQTHWFRIVLDEAHQIRNPSTNLFQAVCEVAAERRWAVTGTPVQNRLDDLGALIQFLRIKPFDEKGAFSQYILTPFKIADTGVLSKLRLLVDSITLRRMKDKIDLPARTDRIHYLDFSKHERELYNVFRDDSKRKLQTISALGRGFAGKTYAHVLKAIMRMRLVCAHGEDLLNDEDRKLLQGLTSKTPIVIDDNDDEPTISKKQAFEMLELMRQAGKEGCDKCGQKVGQQDDMDDEDDEIRANTNTIGYMTACFHVICPKCWPEHTDDMAAALDEDSNTFTCPLCNSYGVRADFFEIKQSELDEDAAAKARIRSNPKLARQMGFYTEPHTKTRELINYLKTFEAQSNALPDGEDPIKSVVFSSWTSHLDLIQIALASNKIPYTRLDGSMSRKSRAAALKIFANDPSVVVILVSIGAGGLGLNLTAGSKVFMMEPQFNPAAEQQAVDRVHRLGQKREVECVRFIMNDSFEEYMLELQKMKIELADLTVNKNKDKAERAAEKLEGLKKLFR